MGVVAAETAGGPPDTEALYREHGGAVAKLCRSLLRERTEAEDATQQVFLSAHRALLNGATPRDPLAWLLAVARNECYARFRQRAVAPLPYEEEPSGTTADAATYVLRAGDLASVWDEVGQMPPKQREAFLLREIRGLSYGQLADELALSPPSVRSLILRARTRLRRRLGDVVAGLGGAPWVQQLLRLVSGAEGASPLPSATKAAAVGIGTLALVGGGGLVARQVSRTPAQAGARQSVHKRAHRAMAPTRVVGPSRSGFGERTRLATFPVSHEREVGSAGSGSHDGSSDGGRQTSGDGSGETTTAPQSTRDGHDGSTGMPSSSGSSDGGVSTGSDGGTSTSGSRSGSDGGSGSTATVTTSSSGGSDGGSSTSDGGSGSDSSSSDRLNG